MKVTSYTEWLSESLASFPQSKLVDGFPQALLVDVKEAAVEGDGRGAGVGVEVEFGITLMILYGLTMY